MSLLTNKNWFDENGNYVPLCDRKISENDIFGRIMKEIPGIEDYTQIGSYLHVHTDRDPNTIREMVEEKHGNIRVSLIDSYSKGHTIAQSDRVVKLQFHV